jgi:O-antigen/teichoic acid export membrane protein
MAGTSIFKTHHTWEDWIGMLLGIAIGLSPWFVGMQDQQGVMWNALIIGGLVVALSGLEMVDLRRWEETATAILGAWLICSPFILDYAGSTLATWHLVLGTLVVLLAALELWQDWRLSDADLARHGQ